MNSNKEYKVLDVQSIYEVPIKDIRTKGDLHEFYKDAELTLNEAYQFAQTKIPLPAVKFPPEPIENYQKESDVIFQFICSLN